MSISGLVYQFHRAFNLPVNYEPSLDREGRAMRARILREEFAELEEADAAGDIVGYAHELADLVYVAYGNALTMGFDLDDVIREVHRANMSKLDENGKPIMREDGKVLKSDRYRPPNVAAVINVRAS